MGAAFALGFALGAAPGPVQVLILSETAKRGFSGGLRVMLGANGTLLVIMLLLALGLSSFAPGERLLDTLRVVGGTFLVYVAVTELRSIVDLRSPRGAEGATKRTGADGRLGPTTKGIVAVVLNPGAWIFFATTASAVIADASASGGRSEAILAAIAMAVGVSASDILVTSLGTGGRALLGDRGLTWIRAGLAALLMVLGIGLVLQGAGLV
jgi:threonine/homoserine/homoserine lactone efflux protein